MATVDTQMNSKICRICGDKALCFNYDGEQSCASCRVFFRRNAPKQGELKCPIGENSCEIDYFTRKSCAKCRLDKCLANGMRWSGNKFTRQLNSTKSNNSSIQHSIKQTNLTNQTITIPQKSVEQILEYKIQNHLENLEPIYQRSHQQIPPIITKKHSMRLNGYEQAQIGTIHRAISSFFEEESHLPVVSEVKSIIYMTDTISVYTRRCVRFCKSIPVFSSLDQSDQLALLKKFIFDCSVIRYGFQYNQEKNKFRMLGNEMGNESILVHACDDIDHQTQYWDLLHHNLVFMSQLNLEMEKDFEIRNLLTALQLMRPVEKSNCPDSVRYQYYVYSHLLLRYLEHKYNDLEIARKKFTILTDMMQVKLIQTKENIRKVLKEFCAQRHIAEIIVELWNLNE